MKVISWKDMLHQLKKDLIGKDSYRGVTLTYTWLANQFGHFSLGFIPTYLTYFILKTYFIQEKAALYSALIISIGWLLFETYNFLGPLLLQRKYRSDHTLIPAEEYTFPPAWRNIAFDTFTDVCFFWTGALTSSLLSHYTDVKLVVLVTLIGFLMYPSYYWYLTKMYLQQAIYPFQFRLSQWDLNISDENKKIVYKFLDNPNRGSHLLVFGSKNSGQNSLCVAIGTERAIKHQSCTYITAMKLFSMFYEDYNSTPPPNDSLWNWRNSSLLVIDDIHPGDPISDEIISPKQFINFITNSNCCNENLKAIKDKDVLWVMGNVDSDKSFHSWECLFEKIGVEKKNIHSINLMQ